MDLLYIGVATLFFILTWGLAKLCDVLAKHDSGEKQ